MASRIFTYRCARYLERRSVEYHAENDRQRSLSCGHASDYERTLGSIAEALWRNGILRSSRSSISYRRPACTSGLRGSIHRLDLFVDVLSNGTKEFQSIAWWNLRMYQRRSRMEIHCWTSMLRRSRSLEDLSCSSFRSAIIHRSVFAPVNHRTLPFYKVRTNSFIPSERFVFRAPGKGQVLGQING